MLHRIRLFTVPALAIAAFLGLAAPAHAYDARVTLKDLREAQANCVGTTCRLGGLVWDCSGGKLCTFSR